MPASMSVDSRAPRASKTPMTQRRVLVNFMVMSTCFALNHGTVTALIALASSSLGKDLGNVSSGLLYLVYTLTAAFCSNAMTAALGAKRTLFVGLGIYCAYVVSYLIAYLSPSTRWVAVLTGAVLGGFAAGSIWPAQGAYYARCAEAYADATITDASKTGGGTPREAANAVLGSYFAATYLTAEVSMKLLSSIIPTLDKKHGDKVLFAFFASVAVAATAGILSIDSFGDDGALFSSSSSNRSSRNKQQQLAESSAATTNSATHDDDDDDDDDLGGGGPRSTTTSATTASGDNGMSTSSSRASSNFSFGSKALQALRLFSHDPKCSLMVPMNFAFGLGSAFVNGYFNAGVVSAHVGKNAVGYVSSTLVGAAALLSLPYGSLGKKLGGQALIVSWGATSYFLFAAVNIGVPARKLGHWPLVVLLAVLFGNGRAVWEGNFKASVADYFKSKDVEAAFANVQLQSGLASTVGFFMVLFATNPKIVVGAAVAVASIFSVVAQLLAGRLHRMETRDAAIDAGGGAYVRAPSEGHAGTGASSSSDVV